MSMPVPTIEQLTASAWYKVGLYNKGHRQYELSVFAKQSVSYDKTKGFINGDSLWTIEYAGESLFQPFVIVKHTDPLEALNLFDQELKVFEPASVGEIDKFLNQRKG